MKLTPHLLSTAPSYLNPLHDRVIILRGLKAQVIENFGVTNDLYETVDLTDNEIEFLGNFPNLYRLKTLLISENHLDTLDLNLALKLPNLTNLNLASNSLKDLTNVCKSLQGFTKLKTLVLKDNPVVNETNYRSYVIWLVPSLQILDFEKIKDKERQFASELFKDSKNLIAQKSKVVESKTVENNTNEDKKLTKIVNKLTDEERKALELKLLNASNLDEIEMIENALKNGVV